jgi:hypothetical protein
VHITKKQLLYTLAVVHLWVSTGASPRAEYCQIGTTVSHFPPQSQQTFSAARGADKHTYVNFHNREDYNKPSPFPLHVSPMIITRSILSGSPNPRKPKKIDIHCTLYNMSYACLWHVAAIDGMGTAYDGAAVWTKTTEDVRRRMGANFLRWRGSFARLFSLCAFFPPFKWWRKPYQQRTETFSSLKDEVSNCTARSFTWVFKTRKNWGKHIDKVIK